MIFIATNNMHLRKASKISYFVRYWISDLEKRSTGEETQKLQELEVQDVITLVKYFDL